MVNDLGVATSEALVTEFDEVFASLQILHGITSITSMEDVCEHLKIHLVDILDRLGLRVRKVLSLQEFKDACFDHRPVLGHDVLGLDVFKDQETEEISDGNLVLIGSDNCEITKLIDSKTGDRLEVEAVFNPLDHVRCRLDLARRIGCKVADERLHLINLADRSKAHG